MKRSDEIKISTGQFKQEGWVIYLLSFPFPNSLAIFYSLGSGQREKEKKTKESERELSTVLSWRN